MPETNGSEGVQGPQGALPDVIPTRPPIGLKPRWLVEEERLKELIAAIVRRVDSCYEMPIEWVIEYNELASRIKGRERMVDDEPMGYGEI